MTQTSLLMDTSAEDNYPDSLLKPGDVDALIAKVGESKRPLAIDTEFSAFDTTIREMWGFSLALDEDHSVYVPVGHRLYNDGGDKNPLNIPRESAERILRAVFNSGRLLVAHNWVAELTTFEVFGCSVPEEAHLADTMISGWILARGAPQSFGLKPRAEAVLGVKMEPFYRPDAFTERLLKFGAYAADDTRRTLQLWLHDSPQIEASPFKNAFYKVEIPIMRVLAHMKLAGFKVDFDYLRNAYTELNTRILATQKELDTIVKGRFPTTSPKAISRMMFDDLGWWTSRKERGASGAYPTNITVLEDMEKTANDSRGKKIASLIVRFRKLATLRDRYTKSLAELVCTDGRIRASFMSHGTVTGRFASSGPNLQNLPRPGDAKKQGLPVIRSAFIAEEGSILVVADYSQVELRLLAHYSGDKALVDAYMNGIDIHQQTADACGSSRQDAKPTNFGLMYGMSPRTLARQIGTDERTAAKYHRGYFKMYTGVKTFHQEVFKQTRRDGFVSTLTGRQRVLPDIMKSGGKKAAAEREAVNTIIQGSAADLMKIAMVNLYNRWRNPQDHGEGAPVLGVHVKMLATVHDELVCEASKSHAARVSADMKEEFEAAVRFRVPLVADPAMGRAWSDAK